ncbi:MAG: hypothetical protein JST54_20360 [Deltaproteobacteria bacterium]|nr:hypothetical protein [Deltaproteobacteria bacterium]
MRAAGLVLLCALASGCSHASNVRSHAGARLVSLSVRDHQRGSLELVARYQLDGLPLGDWKGDSSQLTVSLDDVPFASVVAAPRYLPGDVVELPVGVAFARAPAQVQTAWSTGAPVRVRIRGRMTLVAGQEIERIPTDVEQELVLPEDAVPQPRS